MPDVTIFASGNLDERELARLLAAGAPIDGFGVGSRLAVSADAPYLDAVYKLVAVDGRPVLKLSPGKATLPGAKQVWRRSRRRGDTIALADEPGPDGATPLLEPAMTRGVRLRHEPLAAARERAAAQRAALAPEHRGSTRSRTRSRLVRAWRSFATRSPIRSVTDRPTGGPRRDYGCETGGTDPATTRPATRRRGGNRMADRGFAGIGLGGILVIVGIVVAIAWSFWGSG